MEENKKGKFSTGFDDDVIGGRCSHGSNPFTCRYCRLDGPGYANIIRERDALKAENDKLKDNIIEGEKVIFQLRQDLEEAVRIARKNESEFDDEHVEFYCGFCPKILSDCHKKPCADRKFLSRFPVQEKGSEGVV